MSVRPVTRVAFSLSEQETYELGLALAGRLRGGELVVLEGDLGLGKTVFARGIAASLGVLPEDVTSPSFALVQEYRGGRLPMYHVDLYRLGERPDIADLGLEDLLASGGVVVVEWGERLPVRMLRGALVVRFSDLGEGTRRIEIGPAERTSPSGPADA